MRAQRGERVRVCSHVRRRHPCLGRQRAPRVARRRAMRPLVPHRSEVPIDSSPEAPDGTQADRQTLAPHQVGEQAGRAGGEELIGDGFDGRLEGLTEPGGGRLG